jgi:purine-cytosine permease-like protein
MIAILVADFFILRKDHAKEAVNITNFIIWIAGFIIYRLFMSVDTVVGNTLPVIIITGIICVLANGVKKLCLKKS